MQIMTNFGSGQVYSSNCSWQLLKLASSCLEKQIGGFHRHDYDCYKVKQSQEIKIKISVAVNRINIFIEAVVPNLLLTAH